MSVRKGEAFATVHFTLAVMAAISIGMGVASELWPGLIAGMVANATAFLAANVSDNAAKGKYYAEGLDKEGP